MSRKKSKNKMLDISAILKDTPRGTKLYSPWFGNVCFEYVEENGIINFKPEWGTGYAVRKDGTAFEGGEVQIFPSKYMRDWRKFAWKKGDVLVCKDEEKPYFVIFEAFQNEEYTRFKSRYNFGGANNWLQFNSQSDTNHFIKVSDKKAKAYIEKVEEHYGGKLNPETLEIDKVEKRPYYEAGIYFYFEYQNQATYIAQLIEENEQGRLRFGEHIMWDSYKEGYENARYYGAEEWKNVFVDRSKMTCLRTATSIEVDALKKAKAKSEKECKFKTFQKVLVRDNVVDMWIPALFVRMRGDDDSEYKFKCLSLETSESCGFKFCEPYEGNEDDAYTKREILPL